MAGNVATKDGRVIHTLARLQNFKLLPAFVLVSMAMGIASGKVYGISNVAITPLIDAIKSIFHGTEGGNTMKTKADCYGKMFPDVIHTVDNQAISGKVFGYRVDRPGIGVSNRATTVNREEWQHCLECPEFDGCYQLSMGTMLLERAVKS